MTFWFHPEARAEYREAALHYQRVKPKLGQEFRTEVEAAIASILERSTRFGHIERGIRRCLLKRFPYKIHFLHDEAHQEIVIYPRISLTTRPCTSVNRKSRPA